MSKISVYIKEILIPVLTGVVIGLITSPYMDYEMLNQPSFAPPGFLFPIVWTVLYILMGISQGILKSKGLNTQETELIYYLQLFFNALWSIIFFVFKARLLAFIWIIVLVVLIIKMIVRFYERNKLAGLLQIPYLIWVIFASILNFSVYILNK